MTSVRTIIGHKRQLEVAARRLKIFNTEGTGIHRVELAKAQGPNVLRTFAKTGSALAPRPLVGYK